jgi:pimeloyl-ACP methyl ester carboxylesterase
LLPALTFAAAPESFTVGTLHVNRYGDHGRPLILIPGLGSGAWVWQDTIEHLEKDHVIYAVTLAGFDGTPAPVRGNYLEQAEASLLKLIESRHIQQPVLVGHSLGGTLAIRFAEQHSNLLSGVVAVDGLPVFPGMQDMTATQRQQIAAGMQARMASATPAQFAEQQQQYMLRIGVIDPALAKRLAVLEEKSDPKADAKYNAEDVGSDFRPGLDKITVPLLEISPYYAPDFSQGMMKMTEAQKADYYAMLLKGAPHAQVVSISPSRHFVMFDQPAKFRETLAKFLAGLPRN